MRKLIFGISVVLAGLASSNAGAFDPDGFHQCVLENISDGMGKHAVSAVRQACGHLHDTTPGGGRPHPPVAEDSVINEIKREHGADLRNGSCRFIPSLNDCIVYEVRDALYPSRELGEVREWLYRSQSKHGPLPPREN